MSQAPADPPDNNAPSFAWYVVHTKPRQEDKALLNLERQGYRCYLPRLTVEKIRRGKFAQVTGLTKGVGKYEDVVATQFADLWKGS